MATMVTDQTTTAVETPVRIDTVIGDVFFYNVDTGFSVLSVHSDTDQFSAICQLPALPATGQELTLEGQWCEHPKFGKQFKADFAQVADPSTASGVLAYLSERIIDGVGPAMAKRLVDKFGGDTLLVLEKDPNQLLTVRGVGRKSLDKIITSWKQKRLSAKTVLELVSMGLTMSQATRVYKRYEEGSLYTVKNNPFKLADEISGIGFKTADQISAKLGIRNDVPERVKAGIEYVLKQAQEEGHCFLPLNLLAERAEKLLAVGNSRINDVVIDMEMAEHLIAATVDIPEKTLAYYLPSVYAAETFVGDCLTALSNKSKNTLDSHVTREFGDIVLSDEQYRAADASMRNKLSVITGPAGSGKTTVLKSIIACIEKNKLTYYLAAPTGKAAKRMTEVTGKAAATIHRLLEFDPISGGFKRNKENPLKADYIILDETSMVDLFIMKHLLGALPANASIIFIGDPHQLPPVGVGLVFRDIINSGVCPVSQLTAIHRQKNGSAIIEAANSVREGKFPHIPNTNGVYFFEIADADKIAEKIVELVTKRIPAKFGYTLEDIQVLSPMRKRGAIGTDNLNVLLQTAVRGGEQPSLKGYKVGDKVMQIVNDYDKGVFNGDVGYVAWLNEGKKNLAVKFEGMDSQTVYEYSMLDEIALAYSCTVHKYQGSEAKCVVMPVHTSHYILLKRDLFYTALTRPIETMVLVGSKQAIAMAVKNNVEQKRFTNLLRHCK